MIFIGDVHGKWGKYHEIINSTKEETLQVGDMGIFSYWDVQYKFKPGDNDYFIRGNHDNPDFCLAHPQHLGDFGYLNDNSLFFVAGAWSIDWEHRTPEVDWWKHEELYADELALAYLLYKEKKPKIMVTHDVPATLYHEFFSYLPEQQTRTTHYLDKMWREHMPELWVFGHHHKSIRQQVEDCLFVGLGELEIFRYDL